MVIEGSLRHGKATMFESHISESIGEEFNSTNEFGKDSGGAPGMVSSMATSIMGSKNLQYRVVDKKDRSRSGSRGPKAGGNSSGHPGNFKGFTYHGENDDDKDVGAG